MGKFRNTTTEEGLPFDLLYAILFLKEIPCVKTITQTDPTSMDVFYIILPYLQKLPKGKIRRPTLSISGRFKDALQSRDSLPRNSSDKSRYCKLLQFCGITKNMVYSSPFTCFFLCYDSCGQTCRGRIFFLCAAPYNL